MNLKSTFIAVSAFAVVAAIAAPLVKTSRVDTAPGETFTVRIVQDRGHDYGAYFLHAIPNVGDCVSFVDTKAEQRKVLSRVFFARDDRRYDVTLIVSSPEGGPPQ